MVRKAGQWEEVEEARARLPEGKRHQPAMKRRCRSYRLMTLEVVSKGKWGPGLTPDHVTPKCFLFSGHMTPDTRNRRKDIDPLTFPLFSMAPLYQQTLKMRFRGWTGLEKHQVSVLWRKVNSWVEFFLIDIVGVSSFELCNPVFIVCSLFHDYHIFFPHGKVFVFSF
ncbi:hypothetical protein STEG23_018454 [Scotinomys teguina]